MLKLLLSRIVQIIVISIEALRSEQTFGMNKSFEEKQNFFLSEFTRAYDSGNKKMTHMLGGKVICRVAFCQIYGTTNGSYYRLLREWKNGVRVWKHGNCETQKLRTERMSTEAWFQNYIDDRGMTDDRPDCDKITLPCCFQRTDAWADCREELGNEALSYSEFCVYIITQNE
eukprot:Lithocolla_globosa_v1_NODE_1730_length_2376_cov_5.456700.p2 type:complete len:172 gc:universal NODE_1730_length_2376_cov_5.456700:109-624(+)